MIVNLTRRVGDCMVVERIEGDTLFEGGAAQLGVLATFTLDGHEVTGRIINVVEDPEAELIVEVELIDEAEMDAEAEFTRENLPPENDAEPDL
jgi:hypothetical protein